MNRFLLSKLTACLLLIRAAGPLFSAEENFLLIDGVTDEVLLELGSHLDQRIPPLCTFTILLSLAGYDVELLSDEKNPVYYFQEGYADYFESWKLPQTPASWLKTSCVWYSELVAEQLGLERVQNYLKLLEYGNQEMMGGGELTQQWLWESSLTISPREQTSFIQGVFLGRVALSTRATQMTKTLLFLGELPDGWKLFGKTGFDFIDSLDCEVGWFVSDGSKKERISFRLPTTFAARKSIPL